MDFRLLIQTFTMVFLAEIGDKTQLTAMTLAADNHTFLAVFIGAALGLVKTAA